MLNWHDEHVIDFQGLDLKKRGDCSRVAWGIFLMVVEQICPVCADGSTNLHVIKFHRTMCLVTQSYPTLCDPIDCSPPGSSVHGVFLAIITGMGCQALLQVIFPTQGSNPGLLHYRQILYGLSHQRIHSHTWVHVNTGETKLNDVYSLVKSCINVNFLVLIIRYYNYIRYHH